eukprot:4642703-Lingulodinium_polyedra.AAC.1
MHGWSYLACSGEHEPGMLAWNSTQLGTSLGAYGMENMLAPGDWSQAYNNYEAAGVHSQLHVA